eukprot:s8435_g2.t1
MVDRSGNWADDKLLGQRIETVLGLKQWIVDDAAGLAEQLYERLSVDELHELQLARDERLAEYCQGTGQQDAHRPGEHHAVSGRRRLASGQHPGSLATCPSRPGQVDHPLGPLAA